MKYETEYKKVGLIGTHVCAPNTLLAHSVCASNTLLAHTLKNNTNLQFLGIFFSWAECWYKGVIGSLGLVSPFGANQT